MGCRPPGTPVPSAPRPALAPWTHGGAVARARRQVGLDSEPGTRPTGPPAGGGGIGLLVLVSPGNGGTGLPPGPTAGQDHVNVPLTPWWEESRTHGLTI